jgi:hypothetical protein
MKRQRPKVSWYSLLRDELFFSVSHSDELLWILRRDLLLRILRLLRNLTKNASSKNDSFKKLVLGRVRDKEITPGCPT